jgi:hypothetical protein
VQHGRRAGRHRDATVRRKLARGHL